MDEQRILDKISCPADLRLLADDDLNILAREIREEILAVTSQNGGHVASSLGSVELILALHSLLNCPYDKLVFDVGHQAYAHKLITGRLSQFGTLRRFGGISGFPKPEESPYDVHYSGHASDALSTALGLAKARDLAGNTDQKIVAMVGDAAISGGMAFEAINQIGHEQIPMLIVLNDNEMSISRNVGALVHHFGRLRASSQYRRTRDSLQEHMENSGKLANAFLALGKNAKESMKQFFVPEAMLFEQLGIVCTTPIDGHDIKILKQILSVALATEGPVLVHVVTRKGAGYGFAEANPETFHGIGPFDIATGLPKKKPDAKAGPRQAGAESAEARQAGRRQAGAESAEVWQAGVQPAPPTYTEVFGRTLLSLARKDERLVAITAAMKGGTGLDAFAEEFPDRFIDVGINEEHAVALAGGLALGGMRPVVAMYSTFLQRAVDQLIVNNALPNLDVIFAIDRGGVVGEDGPTHHGVFDLVFTRMIPHMKVLCPSDEAELADALYTAYSLSGPVCVRYPRGTGIGAALPEVPRIWETGKARLIYETSRDALGDVSAADAIPTGMSEGVAPITPITSALLNAAAASEASAPLVSFLAFGRLVQSALEAALILERQGVSSRVFDMRWVKPLDYDAIARAAASPLVLTLEEGVIEGGIGQELSSIIAASKSNCRVMNLGVKDSFVPQGTVKELLAFLELDGHHIARKVLEHFSKQEAADCV